MRTLYCKYRASEKVSLQADVLASFGSAPELHHHWHKHDWLGRGL